MFNLRPRLLLPLAAALGICSGANSLHAGMAGPAESQQEVQHRLDALGPHFKGGSLARWSNPDDQKVLEAMWDPKLLGRPPYSGSDVSSLVTMLKAQASVLRLYTTAGHTVSGSEKEARVRTKYQEEIVRSSVFLTATSAALLQAMGDFVGMLKPGQLKPGQRQDIEDGRSGIRGLLESFTAELKLPEVTAANKTMLLDALAANAETIAVYSPQDDRKRYVRAASAALAGLSTVEKAKLEVFIKAMETKECKGLCSLKG